jgi:ABC-type glycerol-3-phosphate transport system permease component
MSAAFAAHTARVDALSPQRKGERMATQVQTETTATFDIQRQAVRDRRAAVTRKWVGNVVTIVLYAIVAIVFVTPMLWVFGNSFRTSQSIFANIYPVTWKTFIPYDSFSLNNYFQALGIGTVARGLGFNLDQALFISLTSALVVVASSLIFNTGAAYFFGRLAFPHKRLLFIYVIVTMMIPQQVVIVPLFLVVNQLGFTNTFWALVVPWYASPFIVFALTAFFADLPRELDEAAIIDGANLLQVLTKVVIPNSIPGLLTVSLLEFQFIWNEFYWPLVAISKQNLMPVQVAIATQFTDRDPQWGRVFAAMVLASLPVILLFMILQRYFYESAAMTGIKG